MTLTRSTANGTINRALGTLTKFSRQTKSQPSNFTDLFSLPQISLHRYSLSQHVAAFRYFTLSTFIRSASIHLISPPQQIVTIS